MFYWLCSVLILIGMILGAVLIRLFVEFTVTKIFDLIDFVSYKFCVDWENIWFWTFLIGGLIVSTCIIHSILIAVVHS